MLKMVGMVRLKLQCNARANGFRRLLWAYSIVRPAKRSVYVIRGSMLPDTKWVFLRANSHPEFYTQIGSYSVLL